MFGAFVHRTDQAPAQFRKGRDRDRQANLALERELALRVEPAGRTGVADHEGQFAFLGCARVPDQVVRRANRLAVFVGAQEARIERIAREVEVVGIAAEGRGPVLRCPDEAHVRILAIGIELVLAAAEQRDDLAARRREIGAVCLFDLGDLGIAGTGQCVTRQACERGLHVAGHVGDLGHHFGLLAGAHLLVAVARGDEAGIEQVFRAGRIVEQAGSDAVVVGEDQALGRDEAGRASAGQANGALLHLVEPGLVRGPAVSVAHGLCREIIEGPHALVGFGRSGCDHGCRDRNGCEAGDAMKSHLSLRLQWKLLWLRCKAESIANVIRSPRETGRQLVRSKTT